MAVSSLRNQGILATALIAFLIFVSASTSSPAASPIGGLRRHQPASATTAPYVAAILVEARSGQVLFEQDARKPWPPASLTKMMLMLIVMEKVRRGELALEEPIPVSGRASQMGGSQVYLKEGESFALLDLMKAIAIHSANDASQAVAERLGGTGAGFVALMNQRAKELGFQDTRYGSVHGLPPEPGQPADMTSAHDVARLARELVKFPEILKWTSTLKEPFRGGEFILENTNRLIGKFPGADGLKTGSYHNAGFNLAATAQRDGLRLIAVTLGSPQPRVRFREAGRLLSMGFDQYQLLTLLPAGSALPQELVIRGGTLASIHPTLPTAALVLVQRARAKEVTYRAELDSSVWAPLRKGQKLGELVVTLGDRVLGKFPLIADRDVDQARLIKRLWDRFF